MALTPAHRTHVANEQMRMVLLHTRIGTVAASGFAVLLALHLQAAVPALPVLAWLAVKLVVALARIALSQAYARHGPSGLSSPPHPTGQQGQQAPHGPPWQPAMLVLLAVDGLVWGVAGFALMQQSVPVTALAVAALDGIACVATFGLQVRLAATAAYAVPILLPTALGLALRGDEIALFAAASQLILLALLLATARATSQQLATGMLLRLQADRLVAEKDAALQLAQERSAERNRFMAKVSHELRTPLHGMLGLARLLHLEARDPTVSHRLELIEGSGTHLLGLINDLLEVSRIEAGHFVLHDEVFDLAAQLDQMADLFTLRAADKMDRAGNKAAKDLIAAAKIIVPAMACQVIDRAIQIHGGAGLSQDTFLAEAYTYARFMRIGDGPDQVHLSALGKQLLKVGGKPAVH